MFKYTFECTGKMPPVNLKRPQMVSKHYKTQDVSQQELEETKKPIAQNLDHIFDDFEDISDSNNREKANKSGDDQLSEQELGDLGDLLGNIGSKLDEI